MNNLASLVFENRLAKSLRAALSALLKVMLRIMALLGSLAALLAVMLAFILFNLEIILPWAVDEASKSYGREITVGQVDSGLVGTNFTVRLTDISLAGGDRGDLHFSADAIEVRLGRGLFSRDGLQLDYFGIARPHLSGRIVLHSTQVPDAEAQPRGQQNFAAYLAALPAIATLHVEQGHYDIALESDELNVELLGEFQLSGAQRDDRYVFEGSFLPQDVSDTDLNVRFESMRSAASETASSLSLNARSLNLVWFTALWNSFFPQRAVDAANVFAVMDADVESRWTEGALDTVSWDINLTDAVLDGAISDAKQFVFASNGTLRRQSDDSNRLDINFDAKSLDVTELLQRYPNLFPPKFYAHASNQLEALWIRHLAGRVSGNLMLPGQAISDLSLSVTGAFENYDYRFSEVWPPLLDGQGTLKVTDRQVDIEFSQGAIHGRPLENAAAHIADFLAADPILDFQAQVRLSVDDAMDFFGPNGTVKSGMTDGIVRGSGNSAVTVSAAVPLRRGREFTLVGSVEPQGLTALTSYGIEASDIRGKIDFSRTGLTTGSLQGKVPDGEFELNFGSTAGSRGFGVAGSGSGTAAVQTFAPLMPGQLAHDLNGVIDWTADYSFSPDVDEIGITSSLRDVRSELPYPMTKPSGTALPAKVFVSTRDGHHRRIALQFGTILEGVLSLRRAAGQWQVESGAVAVGSVQMPREDSSGVIINAYLPEFDYERWLAVMRSDDKSPALNQGRLKEISLSADALNFARGRMFHDVNLHIAKENRLWHIDVVSREIIGRATYLDRQSIQEGEAPTLTIDFARCHIPEAQSPPVKGGIDPRNLPRLRFNCADTRYGNYALGKSAISAEQRADSWVITAAEFATPEFVLTSSGQWNYSNTSALQFAFDAPDFGKAMDKLSYGRLFNGGRGSISGNLSWDDALTQWRTDITSGDYTLAVESGSLITQKDETAAKLIGILNYDTLLNRVSADIADFGEEGIPFETVSGQGDIQAGRINVPGLRVQGPTSEIDVSGHVDWNTKQLDMLAKINVEVGKPLTTIATIAGGPVTGLVTYLGKQILEKSDIELFAHQYSIKGPWSEPQVVAVQRAAPDAAGSQE